MTHPWTTRLQRWLVGIMAAAMLGVLPHASAAWLCDEPGPCAPCLPDACVLTAAHPPCDGGFAPLDVHDCCITVPGCPRGGLQRTGNGPAAPPQRIAGVAVAPAVVALPHPEPPLAGRPARFRVRRPSRAPPSSL